MLQHDEVFAYQLISQLQVVFEVVFGSAGVSHITRVRDCSFNDSTCLAHSIHTNNQVGQVVERVEHSEDIHAILDSQVTESEKNLKNSVRHYTKKCTAIGNYHYLISQNPQIFSYSYLYFIWNSVIQILSIALTSFSEPLQCILEQVQT